MRVLKVDSQVPQADAIEAAAAVLRSGGLVALPTETVYGLGANALDPEAVSRIYAAKGRPSYNPLIAHCASLEDARRLARQWPEPAEVLGRRFWPGPLTLVVPKADFVPDLLTAGLPTVAIRVPSHPVAQALLRAVRFPVAAPSANLFTQLSPTSPAHVLKGLTGRVDVVLDAGPSSLGIESTVIDVSGRWPVLLRPGSLPLDEVEAELGAPLAAPTPVVGEAPRPGPGMIGRHYSPRAELRVVDRADLPDLVDAESAKNRRVGLLVTSPALSLDALQVEMPSAPGEYASRLYAALHELDDAGCHVVLVEAPPEGREWSAVRDRLARAAQPA